MASATSQGQSAQPGNPPAANNAASSGTTDPYTCPYHGAILAMRHGDSSAKGSSPMQRFLNEGPADQSAIFIRPDTGEPSVRKNCTCPGVYQAFGAGGAGSNANQS